MAIVKLIFSQTPSLKIYNSVTATSNTIVLDMSATNSLTPQIINVNIGDSVFVINSVSYSIRNISTNIWTPINDLKYNLSNLNNISNNTISNNDCELYRFYGNSMTPVYFKLVKNIATGIADLKLNTSKLTVFPNPAIDEVNVSFTANKEKTPIEVFDIQGRLVMLEETEREIGVNKVSLNISNFSAGIYIVRAGSETFKITKI